MKLDKILDLKNPFFRPLWRRVALVVVCLGWAIIEFTTFSPFWGVLFGAIGLYCGWHFFIVPDTAESHTEAPDEQE